MEPEKTNHRVPIRDLVRYYLRLGLLGFGGPVALVGQMEREMVGGKGWVTKEEMREGIAVCQSLPGPLAIQVGIWLSYLRGGFWGAWAGGWAFILPNFIIVAALGALYVHFGGVLAAVGPPALGRRRRRRPPGRDAGQALHLLPEGRLTHLRERARDRPLPREGPGSADGVAERARVSRRRRHGDDEPRAGRHYGHLRGIPGGRVLGRPGRDDRHLPPILSAGPHRRAGARALPHEPQRARLHQGRVRGSDRDDPRRLCLAGPHRRRRLAHGARHPREPRRAVPLEGQQSPAHRRRGRDRADRVPAAPTDVGLREIGARHEWS